MEKYVTRLLGAESCVEVSSTIKIMRNIDTIARSIYGYTRCLTLAGICCVRCGLYEYIGYLGISHACEYYKYPSQKHKGLGYFLTKFCQICELIFFHYFKILVSDEENLDLPTLS
jgi:hypothetical protein